MSSAYVRFGFISVFSTFAVVGCVPPPPSGPSVVAMPQTGESFAKFQGDDASCRNYAQRNSGNPAAQQQAETNTAVGTAAIGTVLGAGAGALLGAASGHAGAGAAVGAGAGLLGGAAVGSNNAAAEGAGAQRQYDVAYAQCMVAKGNTIQGQQPVAVYAPPPPPVAYVQPYPYGYPLGFTPIFIAAPGWYHGHYYAGRGYYDPHGRFMRGYHPR